MDLRLAAEVKDQAAYITLSHCWGTSQPVRLLNSSYDELRTRIRYDILPKTFQDTVTTTRALGIQYLWIDSLCIIQDLKQDWEEQCTSMKDVYGASLVTIAGPAVSGYESGFLPPRPPVLRELTIAITDREESSELTVLHQGVNEEQSYLPLEVDWPLSRRAWVLQERLLSRRVLYFSTKRLYLECFTNYQFENCHDPVYIHPGGEPIKKSRTEDLGNRRMMLQYWASLIHTYSALALTKKPDRLPALSGLASGFQTTSDLQYLAGVWREDLARGTTWYVAPWAKDSPNSESASPAEYMAPPWSWASVQDSIQYVERSGRYRFEHDFEKTDAATIPYGRDPFGTVKGGRTVGFGKARTFFVE